MARPANGHAGPGLLFPLQLRYQEVVDLKEFEPKIQKLLDDHVVAMPATTIIDLVNINDPTALKAVLEEQGISEASKADRIVSATRRAITERMEEDCEIHPRDRDQSLDCLIVQRVLGNFPVKKLEILAESVELPNVLLDGEPLVIRQATALSVGLRNDLGRRAPWACNKLSLPKISSTRCGLTDQVVSANGLVLRLVAAYIGFAVQVAGTA